VPVISEGRLLSGDLEKADVWSLGVTLFAMVTGHTPWEEATPRHRIAEILRGSGSPKGPTDGDDEHEVIQIPFEI
jgi:serine/threonine protein kinase